MTEKAAFDISAELKRLETKPLIGRERYLLEATERAVLELGNGFLKKGDVVKLFGLELEVDGSGFKLLDIDRNEVKAESGVVSCLFVEKKNPFETYRYYLPLSGGSVLDKLFNEGIGKEEAIFEAQPNKRSFAIITSKGYNFIKTEEGYTISRSELLPQTDYRVEKIVRPLEVGLREETLFRIAQITLEEDEDARTGLKRDDSFDKWFDVLEELEIPDIPRDKFELLFFLQSKLREFYEKKRPEWFEREGAVERAITKTKAMLVEAAETLNDLPWKPWKNFKLNRKKVLEEFVDVLHFWMDALIELGFSPNEVFEEYVRKCHQNMVRQLNIEGYKRR